MCTRTARRPKYLALLEQHGHGYPHIAWRGISMIPLHPGTYDVESRFRERRPSPVGVHLISTTVPTVCLFAAVVPERATRPVNDDLARWRQRYPAHLRGGSRIRRGR